MVAGPAVKNGYPWSKRDMASVTAERIQNLTSRLEALRGSL